MSDDLPSSTDESGKSGWWSRLIHGRGEEATARADVVAFLCSDQGGFIAGQTLVVNGANTVC